MSGHCFFASDIHGSLDRYNTLLTAIEEEKPRAVFLGGDLLPHHWEEQLAGGDFIEEVLRTKTRTAHIFFRERLVNFLYRNLPRSQVDAQYLTAVAISSHLNYP